MTEPISVCPLPHEFENARELTLGARALLILRDLFSVFYYRFSSINQVNC